MSFITSRTCVFDVGDEKLNEPNGKGGDLLIKRSLSETRIGGNLKLKNRF